MVEMAPSLRASLISKHQQIEENRKMLMFRLSKVDILSG